MTGEQSPVCALRGALCGSRSEKLNDALSHLKNGVAVIHAVWGHDYICAITYLTDTAIMFIAIGDTMDVIVTGREWSIRMEDLHVLPEVDLTKKTIQEEDEPSRHALVPKPGGKIYSSYRKIRVRRPWDFALGGAALALKTNGPRIDVAVITHSGAAPIPCRSTVAEDEITGKKLSDATITTAAKAVVIETASLNKNGSEL